MTDKDYAHRGKILNSIESETKHDTVKDLQNEIAQLKARIKELESNRV